MKRPVLTKGATLFLSCFLFAACAPMADMDEARTAYKAKDYDAAYLHYTDLAEFGFPVAKTELAKLYLYGRGAPEDPATALALFQEASEEGDERALTYLPRAQAKLASMALKGKIDGYSNNDAIGLLTQAANTGNRDALFEMGYAYEKGLGVQPDGEKAAHYYRMAAEQGHVRAPYYEGQLYMKGEMVPQNTTRAITLYEDAGKKGYTRAYEKLGDAYEEGKAVPQNPEKAAYYYRMAEAGKASS